MDKISLDREVKLLGIFFVEDVVFRQFLQLDTKEMGFFHDLGIQVILSAKFIAPLESLVWGASRITVYKIEIVSQHLSVADAITLL